MSISNQILNRETNVYLFIWAIFIENLCIVEFIVERHMKKKTKLYFNISIYLMYIYIKNKIYTYMFSNQYPDYIFFN